MSEPIVRLQHEPLDPEELRRAVSSPDRGGVVVFCGDVRSVTGQRETDHLEYEAYETMAVTQMRKLAAEIAQKYQAHVSLVHRLGKLMPGETAVVCVAACAHRDAAFEACRELIDRTKATVPIWKKEVGPEGQEWVSPHP